ncbi:MAG: prepilin peptidase [Deltaproteobacteria bacterium]|nr:prepilin peptidase [Deltaproteobacteria bacterium]
MPPDSVSQPALTEFSWAMFTAPATELMPVFTVGVVLWCFFVGSSIGSFLNVVIARLPEGLSVVSPRSRCPVCMTPISSRDNIPILSWLVLRGKCRECKTPISPRYLLVEAFVGLLAVGIALRFGISLRGVELFFFACIMVSIAFIDIDTWHIPFELLGAGLVLALLFGGLGFVWPQHIEPALFMMENTASSAFTNRLFGGVFGLLLLGSINIIFTWRFRKNGRLGDDEFAMGWGDPLMFGIIGLVIGAFALAPVLFFACVQGLFAAALLHFLSSKEASKEVESGDSEAEGAFITATVKEKSDDDADSEGSEEFDEDDWEPPAFSIQFGPFLALAALEIAFFLEPILRFYERLTLPLFS